MAEVFFGLVGVLVGSGIGLWGTWWTLRDARAGRTEAVEREGAAHLLAQLHRVSVDSSIVREHRTRTDFTEECLTAILAFADAALRRRLTQSVELIADAATDSQFMYEETSSDTLPWTVQGQARRDIRKCLEARFDRRALPAVDPVWEKLTEAYAIHLQRIEHDIRWVEEQSAQLRQAENGD